MYCSSQITIPRDGSRIAVWSQQKPASTLGKNVKGFSSDHVLPWSAERVAYQFPVIRI
jgi:hypothetical protein